MNKKDFNAEGIRVITFDADDTLWSNEPYFHEAELAFCELFSDYITVDELRPKLLEIEIRNIKLYGYGIKGFMLSMMETALYTTRDNVTSEQMHKILGIGKDMLQKPVELLDGVEEVLSTLEGKYQLVLATKGDLFDQEQKIAKSGLAKYFSHVEVMSNKKEENYKVLLQHLRCTPEEFLMIGNSPKSDIIPLINIGARAIHIPFHTTWEHEVAHVDQDTDRCVELESIREVLDVLSIKQ